jgi:hypothetical protein
MTQPNSSAVAPPPATAPQHDYIALQQELNSLMSRSDLTSEDHRRLIAISRALRRTNTGPAKAKTAGSKAKGKSQPVSLDELFKI